jgi:hypothetical protein
MSKRGFVAPHHEHPSLLDGPWTVAVTKKDAGGSGGGLSDLKIVAPDMSPSEGQGINPRCVKRAH